MEDRYFEPVEKVIQEFENIRGIKMEVIEVSSLEGKGKCHRGELLVFLKERYNRYIIENFVLSNDD